MSDVMRRGGRRYTLLIPQGEIPSQIPTGLQTHEALNPQMKTHVLVHWARSDCEWVGRPRQAPRAFGGRVPCSRVLQHCVVAPLLLPSHFPIFALPLGLELRTPDRLAWMKPRRLKQKYLLNRVLWWSGQNFLLLSKLPPCTWNCDGL